MKILLIGNGRWGQNYVKTISYYFPNIRLEIANRSNWKDKIAEYPNGVIIATPPQFHIEIADFALSKDIPTMIEKPLSLSLKEAEQLKQYQIPILINHIHLFSDAYQNIKQFVNNKKIVEIYSLGTNGNPPRDYSVLWDHAPHDLSLILDLLQEYPNEILISKHNQLDLFDIELKFNHCNANIHCGIQPSIVTPNKCRLLQVNMFDGTFVGYDDIKRSNICPSPLYNAIAVFLNAINGKDDPRLGLDLSLRILQILEQCQKMLS